MTSLWYHQTYMHRTQKSSIGIYLQVVDCNCICWMWFRVWNQCAVRICRVHILLSTCSNHLYFEFWEKRREKTVTANCLCVLNFQSELDAHRVATLNECSWQMRDYFHFNSILSHQKFFQNPFDTRLKEVCWDLWICRSGFVTFSTEYRLARRKMPRNV